MHLPLPGLGHPPPQRSIVYPYYRISSVTLVSRRRLKNLSITQETSRN
ncbi:Bgt-20241 [Blumeria graminis f. sp. tritici]|uniref:Bgt-20241 n=1 Tax=Blumeria graminis f. sp. tritici TaxID=62690 RepID=A0A9X9MPP8_BLUGR|nr:Bgt-20241 [Blumeria graminis f. sp. tritici]